MICRRAKIAGLLTRNISGLTLPGKERLNASARLQTRSVMNSTAFVDMGGGQTDLNQSEGECSPG